MAKFTAFRPQILLSPRLSFLSPHKRPQRFFAYSSPQLSLSLVCSSLPNPSPIDFSHLPSVASGRDEILEDEFLVINFYKFVFIKDPQEEVTKQLDFLQGRDIHGRIYISEQGINAQYSGPRNDAIAYVEFLRKDPRFSDILVQTSPALNGHAFPRLKLRYKPSLVQMERLMHIIRSTEQRRGVKSAIREANWWSEPSANATRYEVQMGDYLEEYPRTCQREDEMKIQMQKIYKGQAFQTCKNLEILISMNFMEKARIESALASDNWASDAKGVNEARLRSLIQAHKTIMSAYNGYHY